MEPAFLSRPVTEVARGLIGGILLVDGVGGRIVETEAYDRTDPASHTFRGPTPRNAAMFGPVGRAYVYRSYGIHWCLNVVCGVEPGSAVLLRALEPLAGIEVMRARRGVADPRLLCRGPGRLCQALGITGALDGRAMDQPPFSLEQPGTTFEIITGRRIGLTKGVATEWRFAVSGSAYVSRGAN